MPERLKFGNFEFIGKLNIFRTSNIFEKNNSDKLDTNSTKFDKDKRRRTKGRRRRVNRDAQAKF